VTVIMPSASAMCRSEAGSYLRLLDFGCHSTLGLRAMEKKKKSNLLRGGESEDSAHVGAIGLVLEPSAW
jgi:hypothetical protein